MRIAPQHLLSISRIVLGFVVLGELCISESSAAVLPAVVLACAADYTDGIVARRLHAETIAGRLLDNSCDVAFLALAFSGFAVAHTWPSTALGWIAVPALAASFGTYLLRWRAAHVRGGTPRPSVRGHRAGVANYALALVGAAEAHPSIALGAWALTGALLVVIALNMVAAGDNWRLLGLERSDAVRGS